MSGDLAVSFTLKLNDLASGPGARALQIFARSLRDMEGVAKSSSSNAISAFQKLASARQILGIRPEKEIQNEIRQTEAAYQRLAASGQASSRELGRAQDAMRQKVSELRKELDGVKSSSGGAQAALSKALAVAGAYQAGKAVLSGPATKTMSYDRQLANLSNTAYAGQSLDARRAGMKTLDTDVVAAVRAGGGTREAALGALDKMVASGAYVDKSGQNDMREIGGLMPILTKSGTAANVDPALLADIAIRGKQTFGLVDTGKALDQAIKAGQLGGFELKDMAKWLPQQMAMGRQSGLKGDEGFKTLLAANQAVAITAGSKEEAGNNLVNLLAKINSQDTAKDAHKLGINLSGTLAAAQGKGVNSLDAFVNLVEQIVGKDKNFVALREKAKNAKGDEQRATFESMGDIMQGSSIGKLVQDRQALMALVGIMQNRNYMNSIRDQLGNARGTSDDAFALIAGTAGYKTEQFAQEKAIAQQSAFDSVNPALGGFAEGLTGVMREWPGFSAAIVGSTTALTALAAAAGAASLASVLTGGGGAAGAAGGSIAGRLAGKLSGLGGRILGAAGSAAGSVAGAVLTPAGLGVTAAAAGGYGAGTLLSMGINKADEKFGTSINTDIGRLVAIVMAGLGHQGAKEALQIEVDVKNGNIVAAVNAANARTASRS